MGYLKCFDNMLLLKAIESVVKQDKKIVFLCLGNKNVNFDCFASFIADELKSANVPAYVYGGAKYPLFGENLRSIDKILRKNHIGDLKIFVDVAKTKDLSSQGRIVVSKQKFQVANSSVKFEYDYSICYNVFLRNETNYYYDQIQAAQRIATYIVNCFQNFSK